MKSIGDVLSNDERWQRLMEKAKQSEDLLYKHELVQWLMNRFSRISGYKHALPWLQRFGDVSEFLHRAQKNCFRSIWESGVALLAL